MYGTRAIKLSQKSPVGNNFFFLLAQYLSDLPTYNFLFFQNSNLSSPFPLFCAFTPPNLTSNNFCEVWRNSLSNFIQGRINKNQ